MEVHAKSRGKLWSDEATRSLIELWSEETIQLSLQNCKTSKETQQVYKTILVKLQSKGYIDFNIKEVVSKIKKLRQKYKGEKDQKRRSGNSSNLKREWKFFKQIDEFLCKKHNISPPCIIDSSAECGDTETNENYLDDLKDSYGRGEVSVMKCQTCDYEQPVHSEGVHVTEGGAIKVYAEEDDFVCPNCTPKVVLDECASTTDSTKDIKNKKEEKTEVKEKITPKRKRKSNMEKSLECVLNHFKQCSDAEFARYEKLEEERIKREHDLQVQRMAIENERQKQEREHEMNILKLIMGQQPLSTVPTPQYLSPMPVAYESMGTSLCNNSDTEYYKL